MLHIRSRCLVTLMALELIDLITSHFPSINYSRQRRRFLLQHSLHMFHHSTLNTGLPLDILVRPVKTLLWSFVSC